jgi:anti-sigma regulatory factor (Ser/Thr protein kinase)
MSDTTPHVSRREIPLLSPDLITRGVQEILLATASSLSSETLTESQAFPAFEDQVARARAFISRALKDHPAREIAMLLTSEMATNCIRHSGTRFFGVTITRPAGGYVRVIVTDEGRTGTPHMRRETTDSENGRGMKIIDLTAERWGVVRRTGVGTATWFDCAP